MNSNYQFILNMLEITNSQILCDYSESVLTDFKLLLNTNINNDKNLLYICS